FPLSSSSPRHATPRHRAHAATPCAAAIAVARDRSISSSPRDATRRLATARSSLRPDHGVLVLLHPRAAAVDGCNSYLHADENGRSVYHGNLRGGGGASLHNAVWAVEEVVAGGHPTRYVLLRGAYGRYLGSPDSPKAPTASATAAARSRQHSATATATATCWIRSSGRYLCGNQTFLARRPGVSVDGDVDNETTLRWEVVRVTPSQGRPELPIATEVRSSYPSSLLIPSSAKVVIGTSAIRAQKPSITIRGSLPAILVFVLCPLCNYTTRGFSWF
uniref:DUF569 domain-containing protein n=1 Tax=Oryza nivara TaxID=4536 RepID=A0A0E0I7M6_ORYNI